MSGDTFGALNMWQELLANGRLRARINDLKQSAIHEVQGLISRFDRESPQIQETGLDRIGLAAAEELKFFRTWLRQPIKTGSIATSSRTLGRAMAAQVDWSQSGLVVELGPGTGVVTECLIAAGCNEERLVAIEYDEDFCQGLQDRYPHALVLDGDAYAFLHQRKRFDDAPIAAVVSSLPLLTVRPEKRRDLLEQALECMSPQSPFVQFSYGFDSPIPLRGDAIEVQVSKWIRRNLPPARVWTYRRRAA